MKKFFATLLALLLFIITFIIVAVIVIFKENSENLPNYEQLKTYNPITTTRIYASDGSLISEFSKEKRVFIEIKHIPQNLINAFLAAEDANFYKHSGVDFLAILRTSITNILGIISGEGNVGGASTITQQVVKNFLLTRERTWQRKIKEAILAYRISKEFSKEHILELYLNQIYLGSGSYGVEAASQVYFNKSITDISLEEMALLATLPKAPSKLDPRKNIEKAKNRRDWVLQRMYIENFINKNELETAVNNPIKIINQNNSNNSESSFFSDSVKKELTSLYGSDHVFEDGIVVSTTLDPNLQQIALKSFVNGIEEYDQKHGYRGPLHTIDITHNWHNVLVEFKIEKLYQPHWQKAVVLTINKDTVTIGLENNNIGNIEFSTSKWAKLYKTIDSRGPAPKKISDIFAVGDIILVEAISSKPNFYLLKQIPEVNGGFAILNPHSGKVLAMSGGYVDSPNQFNRATQAMRQPGSTMKTFGYIAALENGLNPASVVIDEAISLNQGFGMPSYSPSNYSGKFYGLTTLRNALEQSFNVTAVRMASDIGLDKVAEVVKRFQVNDNPQKIYSLVLGSTETTVMKMATAYAMMVNGGKKISPALIEKIQDRFGKTIYRLDNRSCDNCKVLNLNKMPIQKDLPMPNIPDNRQTITDPATAYQITSMLQGVVERGTAGRAKSIGKIVAGKTGTTNNSIDSWFVGFSPDLVMAVYIGFDTPKTLGREETGSSVSLPIFINFMKEALKNTPSTPFRIPNEVKFEKIDRLTGQYPNPETPKEHIFSEALKLNDIISEEAISEENLTQEESVINNKNNETQAMQPVEKNISNNNSLDAIIEESSKNIELEDIKTTQPNNQQPSGIY
jgi:penicillin-binding protein 1A